MIKRARTLAKLAFVSYKNISRENCISYCRYWNHLKTLIRTAKQRFGCHFLSVDHSSKVLWPKISGARTHRLKTTFQITLSNSVITSRTLFWVHLLLDLMNQFLSVMSVFFVDKNYY